jgi:hypothetical protein
MRSPSASTAKGAPQIHPIAPEASTIPVRPIETIAFASSLVVIVKPLLRRKAVALGPAFLARFIPLALALAALVVEINLEL